MESLSSTAYFALATYSIHPVVLEINAPKGGALGLFWVYLLWASVAVVDTLQHMPDTLVDQIIVLVVARGFC